MECVNESVMELMMDTTLHTVMCVCGGNYFHHCYNYYYYIFEIMMVLLFTMKPVTCHLVLLVGHWVSIVAV